MERGDVLPGFITRAWWPDGTLYHPSAAALAKHEALERARDQAAEIEAALAAADVLAIVEASLTEATTTLGTSCQDYEPEDR